MGSTLTHLSRKLMGKKEVRVLFVGLDAAGKTTVLYKLKLDEVVTTIPTIGFNVETLEYKNLIMTAWDVGGRDKGRALVRHYYQNTSAVVYIVDSNDHDRLDQVRDELQMALCEDELRGVPFLVFANKQDLPHAMSRDEIVDKLGMKKIRCRPWAAFPTCATTGDGLYDGLDWLATVLSTKQMHNAMAEPIKETVSEAKELAQGMDVMPVAHWFKQLTMKWWGWSSQPTPDSVDAS
ncbi:uncharacterized protein LOC135821684 [Sycon ciliatum]|uniref:uncharacterized protein LOC135821684 n=1 Tax=Sycon ciliatum TaxID=27933 RepID=UPI0020A9E7FF|eukprot:scpid99081/ scgid16409/ ADP-ribosylation factor